MKLNHKEQKAPFYLYKFDGCTTAEVARKLNITDPQNGLQKAASLVIARFRAEGVVEDTKRCPHCHGALTRGRKNGPLHLTPYGKLLAIQLGVEG